MGIRRAGVRGKDPAISPELATAALIGTLEDPNWNVRGDAAAVLGQGGKAAEPAIPALIAALRDRHVVVRAGAAQSLGAIIAGGGRGREAVIPALIGGAERSGRLGPGDRLGGSWE